MKKIELNKVKIANLNQNDLNDVKGGNWLSYVISGWAITKLIEKLSTANLLDGGCIDTAVTHSNDCGGTYSQDPMCTVSVCDAI